MSNIHFLRCVKARFFSVKTDLRFDDTINSLLDKNLLKHRQHPGITSSSNFVEIPKWITDSVKTVLKDTNISKKIIYEHGEKLAQHLHGRHAVIDQQNFRKKSHADNIEKNQPSGIQYNRQIGLYYIAGRSLYDYSVLYNVLNHIKANDNSFKPKTLFDFGSGVGTVMWAATQLWPESLQEYVAIDSSADMNELSAELAKQITYPIKGIFYRQFLPAAPEPSYDLVVSSFSLLDLPNVKTRFDVVQKLWRKTQNYLIIIEEGTNAGFTVVNEARDIVLYNTNLKSEDNSNLAHVFAPCPHDMRCPRYAEDDTPCNFEISYHTLSLTTPSVLKRGRFSYVILKKGARPNDCKQWPRIVRPTLKRTKHVICRTCTASGKLEEFIFTTYKYGKNAYRCARVSKWGDLLPIEVSKDA